MSRSNVWREKRCRRASPSATALQISLATNAKLNAYKNRNSKAEYATLDRGKCVNKKDVWRLIREQVYNNPGILRPAVNRLSLRAQFDYDTLAACAARVAGATLLA